jgi:uncharacterized protein (TIRG00374 family)
VVEPREPALEQSRLRRAALVFVLGSVAILAVVVTATTGADTWAAFGRFGGWLIAALFAVQALRIALEALGLMVLVNGTQEERVGLPHALELTLESYFVGQLLPVTAAGVPYQAYLLTRRGVRAGWATAVVIVKGFVPGVFFFLVLLATIALVALGWEGPSASRTFLKIVGPISALPSAFVVMLLIVMLTRPALFDRLADRVAAFLARKLKGRAAARVEEARALIEEESHAFHAALSALGSHRRWILMWGVLLIVLATVMEFVVGLIIMVGFGYRGSVVGPILLQCLLKAVLAASPTPGSLAVGEGGYLGFFAVYLPSQVVGVSVVLWRLVVYFAPMLVGGILVARRLGGRGSAAVDRKDLDPTPPRGV